MIFERGPGESADGYLSDRPDGRLKWRPVTVSVPAIFTVFIWLWRLVSGLVKTVIRHPVGCGLVAVLAGYWWLVGWRGAVLWYGSIVVWVGAFGALRPAAFRRWVLRPLVTWCRWMWVYRRRWRGVLMVAGVAATAGGRSYVPELVKVECGPFVDRLRVRMVKGQSPGVWADRTPELAHAFGATACRVRSFKPGWLVLVLQRGDSLADPIGAAPIPAEPVYKAVVVGRSEDGDAYRLKVHGTHLLIVGATGSGKGSFQWSIIRALIPAMDAGLVEIWALDPKRMELSFGKRLFTRYAAVPEECAELLEEAAAAMQERAERYAGTRRSHTATTDDPFIVVLVDEVAFLTAYQPDSALKKRILAALATLCTQGRAVGYAVVAALQDPRKEVMSIRNLFPDRIALRLDTESEVDMVLGDGARDRGALCDEIPRDPSDPSVGAGIAYVRLESDPDPMRVRACYVSDDDIKDMEAMYGRLGALPNDGSTQLIDGIADQLLTLERDAQGGGRSKARKSGGKHSKGKRRKDKGGGRS
ncbi:FtsK/SpoIIIE domain-containing protein [Nonomuraea sp. NBC_01738]|uniref:FtsK/SpoIIIE domain-containing protein n=1 Tax=Nonomuraea sp. NBC_01738 TaxID=2976003 RepID=UPI002E0FC2B8|nr:FtsK/SpoIIIE domain-containing protein [Nonomuraea sp. NBC_01738]